MKYMMTNRAMTMHLEEGFEMLMGYDVIFFGEEHDSRIAHEAELIMLTELAKRDSNLVLALEMFERDVQGFLDSYLQGTIPEVRFLDLARPWQNYERDYRPLVELAKTRGLPVIAANVPRRAAAAVAEANAVSPEVVGEDGRYLPSEFHFDSEEYHDRFVAQVEGMPHSLPMKGFDVEALFKAQVLKDAVMAASLEPFLGRRIFFCCGRFHSDFHLGIPYQLAKNHPELKIAVVVCAESLMELPMQDCSRIADFIWIDE